MKKYFILIVLITSTVFVNGQCCSAGNPLTGIADLSTQSKNTIKLSLAYKHGLSKDYYNENQVIDLNTVEKAYFNYSEFGVLYSATNKLSFGADLGYFFDKTEIFKNENSEPHIGSGLGDLALQVRYNLYRSVFKKMELNLGLGTKLPVGVFDQEVENIKLPLQLQPSSGSCKYFGNLFWGKSINKKASIYAFGMFEWAQRIESKNYNQKYGNVYHLAFGGNYHVIKSLNLGLNVLGELKGKSSREDNQVIQSTGGQFVSVTPSVSFTGLKFMMVDARCRVPVYKFYNGIQLGNKFIFEVRLSRRIRL